MTISSADTAELPQVRPTGGSAPVIEPRAAEHLGGPVLARTPLLEPPLAAPPLAVRRASAPGIVESAVINAPCAGPARPAQGRAEIRAERQHARRQRRLYAALGLSVLAGTLGATVIVLDVLH